MTMVDKDKLIEMIDGLIEEMEEEDIGISLFAIFRENEKELKFFKEEDRKQVLKMLKKLSDDSARHKELLSNLIDHLGDKYHEK